MPRFPIDINSSEGHAAVQGQWKYAEGYAPGEANYGLTERSEGSGARLPDYDDSSWATCDDTSAWAKFGDEYVTGFSFVWYRINITVPETVGGRDVRRTRMMFETCVDDYGEIWINGECNRERGTFEGFNRPQRVEVANNPNPGDRHTIAILAANGPMGAPGGGVFVRYTNLSFEWRDDDP